MPFTVAAFTFSRFSRDTRMREWLLWPRESQSSRDERGKEGTVDAFLLITGTRPKCVIAMQPAPLAPGENDLLLQADL